MAGETATSKYVVELDEKMSGPAFEAAAAVEKLRAKMEGTTKRIKELKDSMKALRKAGLGKSDEYKALTTSLTEQQSLFKSQFKDYNDLNSSTASVAKKTKKLKEDQGGLLEMFKKIPGPIGSMASKLAGMGSIAIVAAGAVVAVTGALVAVAAAVAKATLALLKYGIAQADARRSELLHLESLTKLRSIYGIAAGNAGEMQSAIDRVSASTSLGRSEVARYTEQLYRGGVRGANLSRGLEAVTTAAAAMGDEYGRRVAGMVSSTAFFGGSVDKLTARIKARFGDLAKRQMFSLSVQSSKLQESFTAIFSGLKIEPFLEGLHSITQQFSQNTVAGRALKSLAERIFQPMIDGIVELMPKAKKLFQQLLIGALTLEVEYLKLRLAFRDAMNSEAGQAFITTLRAIGSAASFAFSIAMMPIENFLDSLKSIGRVLVGVGALYAQFVGWVADIGAKAGVALYEVIHEVDWAGLGRAAIDGILNGIKAGVGGLLGGVRDVASRIANTFSSALDIHSPSRVFAELGKQIPRGVAVGIDAETGIAERSIEGMVSRDLETAGGAMAQGPAARSKSQGSSVVVQELHVHAADGSPQGFAEAVRAAIVEVLEGAAASVGVPA